MVALSAQLASNLASLMSVNDEFAKTQDRVSSGKAVSSALDNPAVYFRAQTYATRAEGLSTVNAQIDLATKNMTTVSNALDSMYKNLDGTLSTLKDAKSKAVVTATRVDTGGGTIYGATDSLVQAKPLNGSPATNLDSGGFFQVGDTFAVTISDASGSAAPKVKWFRAVGANYGDMSVPAKANGDPATGTADGSTEAKAYNFKDFDTFISAVNAAFGADDIKIAKTTNTAVPAGGTQLKLSAGSNTTVVSFSQVYNSDPTAASPGSSGYKAGPTVDFAALFGGAPSLAARASTLTGQNAVVNLSAGGGATLGSMLSTQNYISYTYSPVTGTGSLASALETRRQAADTFKQTLYGLSNMINDAANPGFNNVLKGEKMEVDLNETGEVKQTFKIDALDLFAKFGYQTNADGTISTNTTSNDFAADSDLSAAITAVSDFLKTLRIRSNAVTAATTMMTARLEYNKAQKDILDKSANAMTAANTAEESAKLITLQTQQSFATTNIGLTKQAEQSLISLLR